MPAGNAAERRFPSGLANRTGDHANGLAGALWGIGGLSFPGAPSGIGNKPGQDKNRVGPKCRTFTSRRHDARVLAGRLPCAEARSRTLRRVDGYATGRGGTSTDFWRVSDQCKKPPRLSGVGHDGFRRGEMRRHPSKRHGKSCWSRPSN